MIEADIEHARKESARRLDNKSFLVTKASQERTRSSPVTGRRGKLVNFDRFLGEYWPHFPHEVKKGLCRWRIALITYF